MPSLADFAFYVFAAVILGFGAMVAFGRNIIYSAFSLLGCFAGVAGLYVLLASDFLAVLQLFVYVGGITVLIVFAVMLTNQIGEVKITNQSMNWKLGVPTAGLMFYLLWLVIDRAPWRVLTELKNEPTTEAIGDLLLTKYLLPFELVSLVLLVALIGGIVIARKDSKAGQA
jgi:NADH-quinone oxidoreductase subunit J